MVPADLGKTLQDSLRGMFQWGARYHAERLGIMAGFIVLSLLIVAWSFSGPDDTNELGAEMFLRDAVVGFDLVIENSGSGDWSDVRITLDRQYVYTTDQIEGGSHISLSAEDVEYAYFIPRPWGREDWEELASSEKPGLHPDGTYEPVLVQIRAQQGRIDDTPERR